MHWGEESAHGYLLYLRASWRLSSSDNRGLRLLSAKGQKWKTRIQTQVSFSKSLLCFASVKRKGFTYVCLLSQLQSDFCNGQFIFQDIKAASKVVEENDHLFSYVVSASSFQVLAESHVWSTDTPVCLQLDIFLQGPKLKVFSWLYSSQQLNIFF